MSKKNHKSSKSTKKQTAPKHKVSYSGTLSLVIPCYNEVSRLPRLKNELLNFASRWKSPLEFILVNDGSSDETGTILNQDFKNAFPEHVKVKVISYQENQGKGAALQAGVGAVTGSHFLTLDADMAASPKDLVAWLKEIGTSFREDTIYIASREHHKSKSTSTPLRRLAGLSFNFAVQIFSNLPYKDTQCGFKLYPTSLGKQLFEELKDKGWAHDIELLYQAQLNNTPIKEMPTHWQHQEGSKISLFSDGVKMLFKTISTTARLNFKHFIASPLKDISKGNFQGSDPSVFRLLFVLMSLFLLVAMPMLSLQYGITGDEHVQKVYGDLILKYFSSGGENQEALSFKNLYYYGGLFDYACAWSHQTFFPSTDIYTFRHIINALVGFLLLYYTGLSAKELSGKWTVGFLALVFIALSPRIFGHSMNNPKDIPFAAAFAFTMLYMIRLFKRLPQFSTKSVFMIALGVALSIGIRVGGIILIAFFGLFAIISLIRNAAFRDALKNKKYLIRVVLSGLFIALLGYFGGLLFWPYGRLAPLENPLTALNEMSNFSIGIRMLFDGEHLWSDELPWYYIPKWFSIASPLFWLLGLGLALAMTFIHFKKKNLFLVGLVAFMGLFPPAYALYKHSSLYDGIRHFLFIYPALTVLAAWGWYELLAFSKHKIAKTSLAALLMILLALPLFHIIKKHPNTYVYFNEISGGVEGAYTKYETDYWMNSVKQLTDWLVANDERFQNGEEITIMTNCVEPVKHYLRKAVDDYKQIKISYSNFRDRNQFDSEYELFISRFVNRDLLENGVFPTESALKVVEMNGVPLASLSKRETPYDYQAYQKEKAKEYLVAAELYAKEVLQHPKNEVAMQGAARAYLLGGDMSTAQKYMDMALGLSDTNTNTLLLYGNLLQKLGKNQEAQANYERIITLNYKETNSYLQLSQYYAQANRIGDALDMVEQHIVVGGNNPQAPRIGVQLAQAANDQLRLNYFQAREYLNQGKAQESYNSVQAALRIDPDYTPAKELLKKFEEAQR